MVLLGIGAVLGVGLAAAGLMGSVRQGGNLPAGAVARVNNELIRQEDYERMLAALASDRRSELDDAQRKYVLDRLIDEELLIQRGLELGMARQDQKVRADLTQAVIASVVAEYEDAQPTGQELQQFFESHRDFFSRPGRLRLRQIFFRAPSTGEAPDVLQRAQEAVRRVRAGEDFVAMRDAAGDRELSPLPDAALPPEKLRDYLGPTVLRAALSLGAGEVSDPIRSGMGYHVVQVVERQTDAAPTLAEIKPQVLAEYRRRAGEDALAAYLKDLRSRAEIATK